MKRTKLICFHSLTCWS